MGSLCQAGLPNKFLWLLATGVPGKWPEDAWPLAKHECDLLVEVVDGMIAIGTIIGRVAALQRADMRSSACSA
eukprot:1408282-Lingulodinium_polyedra.AAC.1